MSFWREMLTTLVYGFALGMVLIALLWIAKQVLA